jgi:hypothetical protein
MAKLSEDRMKRWLLVTLVVCLPVAGMAKKQHEVETAKVISQDIRSHQEDRGLVTNTPLVRYSNTVIVQTATERMTWVEVSTYKMGTRTQDVVEAIPLPINGTVEFYRHGNFFVVSDASHKAHKFSMVRQEIIQDNK